MDMRLWLLPLLVLFIPYPSEAKGNDDRVSHPVAGASVKASATILPGARFSWSSAAAGRIEDTSGARARILPKKLTRKVRERTREVIYFDFQ